MSKIWSIKKVLVCAAAAAVVLTGGIRLTASGAADEQAKAKHYKPTRAYVVDKQNGSVRIPTQQEVDQVVADLTTLGQRSEPLAQTTQASGAVGLDLDGGFAGIVLARPTDDGTWETRCVFTLEEGAAFLGLVEDESVKG